MAQVVEAVAIGTVVLAATFFAVSFQAPPSPQENPATEQTEAKLSHSLRALDDLYINDAGYNHSALSRAIAQAAAGNETPLVNSILPFLPEESAICVHLNNGRARIPLHCPRDPPGAAVGVSYPIEPRWRFHFAETDLKFHDQDSETALGLSEVPILNAHTVEDEGHYVNVTANGRQSWTPGLGLSSSSTSFSETVYSTLVQGDGSVQYPSAAVYMECSRDGGTEPCYASDLADAMAGYGPHEPGSPTDGIRFTVNNSGPGSVPDGATFEARFPVGIDVNASNVSSPNGGFANVRVDGTEPEAETVRAELDGDLAAGSTAQVDVEVEVTDDRYVYKQVDAQLGDGAVSSSQLLLRVSNQTAGTYTGGDSRVVMVSTPKPAGSANADNPEGRWGIAVPLPYGQNEFTNVTFRVEDAHDRVVGATWPGDFHPPSATGSSESSSVRDGRIENKTKQIRWDAPPSGNLEYDGYTFAEFQFVVETDGSQTPASHKFPFAQPRAEFADYGPPAQSIQTDPGIWWREYPPDNADQCEGGCPGYNDDGSLGDANPSIRRSLDARLERRGIPLNGSANFRIAELTDAQREGTKDAIQASEITASPDEVAPGDRVMIHVDIEDLAEFVSQRTGTTNMDLETRIYPPWGIRNRTPSETFEHEVVAGTDEGPNALLPMYVDGNNVEDVLVASSDGNVYATQGNTGDAIAGWVFGVPDGSGPNPSAPNLLSRAVDDAGNDVIGVGTTTGATDFYTVDDGLDERWGATKPEGNTPTWALDVSRDLTGDGVPEVVVTTQAENVQEPSAFNQSRLTIWHGADQDGDGRGDVLDGFDWDLASAPLDHGVVTPGKADQVGVGRLGVRGEQGAWATTGLWVATNAGWAADQAIERVTEDGASAVPSLMEDWTVSIHQSGAGMQGYTKDGRRAFNLSDVRAVRAETVPTVTEGTQYSGIVAGGADGWTWGFNGSQPVLSVQGWTLVGPTREISDVEMANRLEGYAISPVGSMLFTRNAWTSQVSLAPYPELTTVDTPDGGFLGENASVAWWAGNEGRIYRTTGRLDAISDKTTTATHVASVDPFTQSVETDTSLEDLDNFDLTNVNFTDIEAVSQDEAYLVGHGAGSTDLTNNGYIVHSGDGGSSFQLVEIDCDTTDCGLQGIDHDGQHLWVAGNDGIVMARNISGSASDTTVNGSGGIDDRGRVSIPLRADANVTVHNATVTWDPVTSLTYGEAATLADGGDDRDLWNETKGCPSLVTSEYFTDEETCSAEYGYDHGNGLQVKDYTEDSSDGVNRTLEGDGTLTVGPFTSVSADTVTSDPYHGPSWYENPDNLPLTFHVNVTFADGSEDLYTVHVNETGVVDATETSAGNWSYPSQLSLGKSFSTPECFGEPASDCSDHQSVNVTDVSEPPAVSPSYVGLVTGSGSDSKGDELYGLQKDSTTWEAVDAPVYETFRDGAINVHDPTQWIATGGPDGRTLVSRDAGGNWSVAPINPVLNKITQPHYAADWTHPNVSFLFGGGENGWLMNMFGGYAPLASEETRDIYAESDFGGSTLEALKLTEPPTIHGGTNGESPASIYVWNDTMNGGDGGWGQLWTTDGSEPCVYDFAQPVDEVRLKFELENNAIKRRSPTVMGQLRLLGLEDKDGDWSSPDANFTFDIGNADEFATDLQGLEYNEKHGYLRLPAFNNVWTEFLGNEEEGDWTTVRNGTVGARVADLAVAPNESTVWVVTEGIYKQNADPDEPPVTDADCKTVSTSSADATDANVECYDSSLYAIDAETGQRESWWDPIRFGKVPQHLAAGEDSVAVAVGNKTQTPEVYGIEVDDPHKDNSTVIQDSTVVPSELTIVDAFQDAPASDEDPILSVTEPEIAQGRLHAFEAPRIDLRWSEMPSLSENFQFHHEVPEDALYGSRVVSTRAQWNVTDTWDTSLVQSARLHDSFGVTPQGGAMPLSPTYTLEVVAWIEDW